MSETPLRILYMEDDAILSQLMHRHLQRRGYRLDLAKNGEEGLAALQKETYDLLLVDYHMPVLNGMGVIDALARRGVAIPLIMITGEGNVDVAVQALKRGAADYIEKDAGMMFLELLPAVIDHVMERQRLVREKEQMVRAVQESEERYRTLFAQSPLPMWVVDASRGRFLAVNGAAVKHFGYSAEEFLSMTVSDILAENERAKDPVQGKQDLFAGRLRLKSGGTVEVELARHAVALGGNRAQVVIATDVTERKRQEEERLRAQKLESLGHLAGGLAHDFNNVLTAILANISHARMDALDGKNVTELLECAERAAFRARDLAYQLLTFSRGGEPIKKVIPFAEVVRSAAEFALRGSRTRPEFAIAPDLHEVEADEAQLRQVVSNIVINADQAMPAGGVVRLEAANVAIGPDSGTEPAPGPYVKLSFADQGPGIPPEIRDKVFDPYFTTRKNASGMGLATSYSVVRRHGGTISIGPGEGTGAIVTILLPAAKAKAVPAPVCSARPAATGRGRVLIMDDEEIVRSATGAILGALGYEVAYARDGAEAVAAYREARDAGRSFSIVIMDLTIPGGMGGREAIEQLRRIDPEVNAIVSSGYSDDPIMSNYADYGFRGVVPKPYTLPMLRKAIEGLLGPTS